MGLRELAKTDFETAFRIAKQRGMAERARVARDLFSAATASVKGLFSHPEKARPGCEA